MLIDGGNSYYIDDIRRAKELAPKGIHYVDVGTSGGVWGLERGYCMMIGGERRGRSTSIRSSTRSRRACGDIARTPGREKADGTAEQGYLHCGPNGAGHFVKMVHNGIEYGMMAAYAEGLGVLQAGQHRQENGDESTPKPRRCAIPSTTSTISISRDITEVWRRGSVIASWLLDLTAHGARRGSAARASSPAAFRIRAKAAGPSRRRSTKACRRPCSRRRSTSASARAARPTSRQAALRDALRVRRTFGDAENLMPVRRFSLRRSPRHLCCWRARRRACMRHPSRMISTPCCRSPAVRRSSASKKPKRSEFSRQSSTKPADQRAARCTLSFTTIRRTRSKPSD